jgi:hypothetical protein
MAARHRARAISDPRLKITLTAGLLVGAAAMGMTLSQSPITVARVNTDDQEYIATTRETVAACQMGETLPRETSAIRLRDFAFLGPRVTVEVFSHGRVITRGQRGSGWTGDAVTIPVTPLPTTRVNVRLCFTLFTDGGEDNSLAGEPATGARAAHAVGATLGGRVRVEYLRPDRSSWWSLARMVARRMGLGRGWPGAWNALLVLALMGGVALLCARAILQERG